MPSGLQLLRRRPHQTYPVFVLRQSCITRTVEILTLRTSPSGLNVCSHDVESPPARPHHQKIMNPCIYVTKSRQNRNIGMRKHTCARQTFAYISEGEYQERARAKERKQDGCAREARCSQEHMNLSEDMRPCAMLCIPVTAYTCATSHVVHSSILHMNTFARTNQNQAELQEDLYCRNK